MLARKTALAGLLAVATAAGGGAAVASAHGGGSQSLKPPKLLPVTQSKTANVHIDRHYCHKPGPSSTL